MWIVILVVVIVLAGGAYYFLSQNDTNTNSTNNANAAVNSVGNGNENTNASANANVNQTTNENVNAETNSNTVVDTTGWRTYENNALGYSFEYPDTWQYMTFDNIDQRTSEATVFGTGAISALGDPDTILTSQIQTLQLVNGLTAADIAQEFEIAITSSEALEINGHQGLSYEATADSNPTSGMVILLSDAQKRVLHIVVSESQPDTTIQSVFNSVQISN